VIAAVFTSLTNLAHALVARDEEGQGLAEYALIIALIAIVAIVALIFMGSQISDQLSFIGGTLQSQAP
jgi:pilus assembly protein Flp/PilA